jgi:dTDP-4-dehydrorhamnose reductase
MANKTLVITGCGGMLGEAVYGIFRDLYNVYASDIDLNAPWLTYLDVSSAQDVASYLKELKPDYIIHLAALTDMEYCELNPEKAYLTNTEGVRNVSLYATNVNIPLVYISTAGVFDGREESYTDEGTPNPLSVYGKSKYEGERVAQEVPKSIIIRAGWMMGGGPEKDKKFINKIIKQLRTGTKELMVVNDKYGSPCYTYDLARSIKYLLENGHYGIYHGACDGGGNRADIARFVIECLGLANKVQVFEVGSDFFKKKYFATRPPSERLRNIRLKKIAPHLTRDWRVCVTEYMQKFDWKV